MKIDFFIPELPSTHEVMPFLERTQISRKYSNFGPLVEELHYKLAQYFGVQESQVVTLVNGTLALEGAIQTIDSNYHWISPSWTFAATNLALERTSVSYDFGDIDEDWRLSEFDDGSAILDVCSFGDSLKLDRFPDNDMPILVDAAASFPALKKCGEKLNLRQNSIGVVVSFHPTKILPGVEGAVFISNRSSWVEKVRSWSSFGMMPGRRVSNHIGTNAKMNEYQAAVLLASLQRSDITNHLWRSKHEIARRVTSSLNLQTHPSMSKGELSTYWLVKTNLEAIELIENHAPKYGFVTRRWWERGCHNMKAFSHKKVKSLPQTDFLAQSTLGLPFHLQMDEEQFLYIEDSILDILNSG